MENLTPLEQKVAVMDAIPSVHFIAARLRSTGADRSMAHGALVRNGVPGDEADAIINDLDFELGVNGRTLPDDAAPAVVRRLADHRAAVAGESHANGTTLVATRPAAQRAAGDRNVNTLANVADETGRGPRFALGHVSTTAAAPLAEQTKPELTARDRHRMLADAMKRSAQNVSRDRIIRSLTDGGFTEAEANESLATIEQQLVGKRETFERSRKRAIAWASIQIGLSIIMALLGLAVGRVTTLVIFGFMAFRGFQRLEEAQNQTFSNYVLTNR